MRDAHPRLCRKECVDLTPVIVDRRARQSAATNNLAVHAVVRDPLVDTVEAPRVAHELRPLLCLLEAWFLAVPIRHLVVVMHQPQVRSVGGADRLKPQAHCGTGESPGVGQWRAFHAAQAPTMVDEAASEIAAGGSVALRCAAAYPAETPPPKAAQSLPRLGTHSTTWRRSLARGWMDPAWLTAMKALAFLG